MIGEAPTQNSDLIDNRYINIYYMNMLFFCLNQLRDLLTINPITGERAGFGYDVNKIQWNNCGDNNEVPLRRLWLDKSVDLKTCHG